MSKRWFDLLATIGFGIIFAMSCFDSNYFLTNKFFALNGFCLILIFALRRFFYNKEKYYKKGEVVDKKKGINAFQSLMNVVFTIWGLWFLMVSIGDWSGFYSTSKMLNNPLLFLLTFLGWLPILAVNYILNNKVTVWNKGS